MVGELPEGAAAGRVLAWQMVGQVYLVVFILFGHFFFFFFFLICGEFCHTLK